MIERSKSMLYQPPSHRRVWRKLAGLLERGGHKLPYITAGGVLMVEVSKQIAAPRRGGLTEVVKRPLRAFDGITPTPETARGGS